MNVNVSFEVYTQLQSLLNGPVAPLNQTSQRRFCVCVCVWGSVCVCFIYMYIYIYIYIYIYMCVCVCVCCGVHLCGVHVCGDCVSICVYWEDALWTLISLHRQGMFFTASHCLLFRIGSSDLGLLVHMFCEIKVKIKTCASLTSLTFL